MQEVIQNSLGFYTLMLVMYMLYNSHLLTGKKKEEKSAKGRETWICETGRFQEE